MDTLPEWLTERTCLLNDIDALKARVADWEEERARILAEECAPDEKHCTCVPVLRARVAELEAATKNTEGLSWWAAPGLPMREGRFPDPPPGNYTYRDSTQMTFMLTADATALRARLADAEALLERPIEGFEDMPDEKVIAIAESGKAWDRGDAKRELDRRVFLATRESHEEETSDD